MIEFVNHYYYDEDEREFWDDLKEIFKIEDEDEELVKRIFIDEAEIIEEYAQKHFCGDITIIKKKIRNKIITVLENLSKEELYLIIEKGETKNENKKNKK